MASLHDQLDDTANKLILADDDEPVRCGAPGGHRRVAPSAYGEYYVLYHAVLDGWRRSHAERELIVSELALSDDSLRVEALGRAVLFRVEARALCASRALHLWSLFAARADIVAETARGRERARKLEEELRAARASLEMVLTRLSAAQRELAELAEKGGSAVAGVPDVALAEASRQLRSAHDQARLAEQRASAALESNGANKPSTGPSAVAGGCSSLPRAPPASRGTTPPLSAPSGEPAPRRRTAAMSVRVSQLMSAYESIL